MTNLGTVRLTDDQNKMIVNARRTLHELPELASCEHKTKAFIMDFLNAYTSLEVHDMGSWIYAAHREQAGETVAFRADFDAVPTTSGCAAHRCGHDGHTAALLALALMIEGKKLGCSVILLFQHAEENGAGAKECCRLFEIEHIDRMYGCHNIPGEPMGAVLLRKGTFACASCGVEIGFYGKTTHAAYPENGVNPTEAVARLAVLLPEKAHELEQKYDAMTIATIVGMYSGEKAFGVAASEGSVYATLRSECGKSLDELISLAINESKSLARRFGLEQKEDLFDRFPATVNADKDVDIITDKLRRSGTDFRFLNTPFRWSEDFGHYGAHSRATFFGIGSGLDTAPLHTEGYGYPDELAVMTAEVFFSLI